MANLHLVTGYAGVEHVTSADQGSFNAALMGEGTYVLERGNMFSASVISNNKVRVMDGDMLMQGRHIRLPENTYVELDFDNGIQGMKRNDLIVVQYLHDSTNDVEQANMLVINGVPDDTAAVDPTYTQGDIINDEALENNVPLYRIAFDGLNISAPIKLISHIPTWDKLQSEAVNAVQQQVNDIIAEMEQKVDETIGELVKIYVNTDESQIGQTIIITNGDNSFAQIVPENKQVVFGVPILGEWTIKNLTNNTNTIVSTYYYGKYEIDFYNYKVFSAVIDFSLSNPDTMVSYADDSVGMVAGSPDWWNQAIFKDLKNCILKDGEVLGYLNKNSRNQYEDGTPADIETIGNDVMLEIPHRVGYRIEWLDETKLKVSITNHHSDPDYNYDAFSLNSYNDCDKIYIGTYKGYQSGDKIYSSSNKNITTSLTIDKYRLNCRNRGEGYQPRTFASVKLIQCLYIIMYKSLNSQDKIGKGYCGIINTNIIGKVNTGGTNTYGFMSEVIKTSNPSYMTDGLHQVCCFGLEDLWGNVFDLVDGICTDTSRNILTCRLAKDFSNNAIGYENNGFGKTDTEIVGLFMTIPQGSSNTGFTMQVASGSDSTYFCDAGSLMSNTIFIYGGTWFSSNTGGIFYHTAMSVTETPNFVGTRLMYLHEEK